MNSYIKYTLLVLCIIGLFVYVNRVNRVNKTTETFAHKTQQYSDNSLWDPVWTGKTANDCYALNKGTCTKYSNCGLCLKNGDFTCVPGDEQGPLFKDGCVRWMYTNYYDRYPFNKKTTTIVPDWSYFYSDYEIKFPSPVSRSAL